MTHQMLLQPVRPGCQPVTQLAHSGSGFFNGLAGLQQAVFIGCGLLELI